MIFFHWHKGALCVSPFEKYFLFIYFTLLSICVFDGEDSFMLFLSYYLMTVDYDYKKIIVSDLLPFHSTKLLCAFSVTIVMSIVKWYGSTWNKIVLSYLRLRLYD